MEKTYSLFFVFLLVLACSTPETLQKNLHKDSYKIIESNLYFLASDELEGREAASPGERIAGQFIASQLKQYGVKPFGDDGTYFQSFELQKSEVLPSSNITFFKNNQEQELILEKDFIPYRGGDVLEKTKLIYVGYGISDSSIEYDDYKDLDVSGKIVVCMYGTPVKKGDPEFYKELAKFAGSAKKADIAAEKGAKGVLVLQSNRWAKIWQRLAGYTKGPAIRKKTVDNKRITAAWIDTLAAKNLFSIPNISYSDLRDTLNSGYVKNGTVLNTKASIQIEQRIENVIAKNVVGIIEGNDPALNNEIVSVGAHYDHEGIKNGEVYNGADDNASGTVTILESARQISTLKTNNRPVVFVFFTAEEKGLLGAEYFVNNSEYIDNIVVNINMDMVGRESEDTMYVVGSGKISSELYNIVEQANKETTKFHFDYTYDDEGHPERIYYRSDHWKFAEKGIPIVFLTDMHKTDYHKPTDDPEKINFIKLEKTAQLTTHIALKVANLDHKLTRDKTIISEK